MQRHALEGTRVVDFSWIVAGPTCTRILADFGAEVIRIEYDQSLDYCRHFSPMMEGASPNLSGAFNNLNRNKLSATLNAKHPEGMGLLHDLIAVSDVVVENYSSGVLERWGLDYESQRRIRPDIIYLSMSGFGHSGQDKSFTTWGMTAQALSGLTMMSGLPGHEPAGWGFSYMDHMAGYYGAIACAMAIHHRRRTGEGQWVDLSQVESGIVLEGTAVLDKTVNGRRFLDGGNPPGNRSRHPAVAPHNSFRCKGDDRWCVISVSNEEQWSAFARAIGEPEWTRDKRFTDNDARVRHQDELDELIERWTSRRTPYEAMETLQAAGVPAGAVQTPQERVDDDPQLRARGFLPEADHPELGRFKFEGEPVKLSRSPWELRRPAPLLGQHSDYVYHELLGVEHSDIGKMAEEGVF